MESDYVVQGFFDWVIFFISQFWKESAIFSGRRACLVCDLACRYTFIIQHCIRRILSELVVYVLTSSSVGPNTSWQPPPHGLWSERPGVPHPALSLVPSYGQLCCPVYTIPSCNINNKVMHNKWAGLGYITRCSHGQEIDKHRDLMRCVRWYGFEVRSCPKALVCVSYNLRGNIYEIAKILP